MRFCPTTEEIDHAQAGVQIVRFCSEQLGCVGPKSRRWSELFILLTSQQSHCYKYYTLRDKAFVQTFPDISVCILL